MASSRAGTGDAIVIPRSPKEPVGLKATSRQSRIIQAVSLASQNVLCKQMAGMSTKRVNAADRYRYGPEMPYLMGRPTTEANNRLANTTCQRCISLSRTATSCVAPWQADIPQPYLPLSSSASASAGVEKRKREQAGWASSASILGPIASWMSGRVRMAKAR